MLPVYERKKFEFKRALLHSKRTVLLLHLARGGEASYIHTFTQPSRLGVAASLQWGKTPTNDCPRYDTKPSNGEVPVMLELWGMWSTPSLLSLAGPLWSEVVAPVRVLSMG